jgi:peptidoglycan/xylan/chitin deacetylase (PgdA/CDA1 family)
MKPGPAPGKLACLTLDFEYDLKSDCGLYLTEDRVELRRLKEFLDQHQVPLTAFVVGRMLEERPQRVAAAAEELPVEFGLHSYSHDQARPDTAQEIASAVNAYQSFFGRDPEGYRAPNGLISQEGLARLAAAGFKYDSSVFPSLRLDEYGFNHLNLPNRPFWVRTDPPILELPLASFDRLRLTISLSFLKLFGWPLYRMLLAALPLPEVVVIDSHPYDFYISRCLPQVPGWKKLAHARNAHRAYDLLAKLILWLKSKGYNFASMSRVYQVYREEPATPRLRTINN